MAEKIIAGFTVFFDEEDAELLNEPGWRISSGCVRYVTRWQMRDGKKYLELLHRRILSAPAGINVDHVDRNGLNNRRQNIRLANHSQNNANRIKTAERSSVYKGVSFKMSKQRWCAAIQKDGKSYYLGAFLHEHEAAQAYDRAASRMFGDFARLNFPSGLNSAEPTKTRRPHPSLQYRCVCTPDALMKVLMTSSRRLWPTFVRAAVAETKARAAHV